MKTIIEMAREAGMAGFDGVVHAAFQLEAFAALVRAEAQAEEREVILDLVDSYAKNNTDLAEAIRARGNT